MSSSTPLPTFSQELSLIESTLQSDYRFDERLLLHLRLAIALGGKHVVLRIGTPHDGGAQLNKAQKKEAVRRVSNEVNWILSNMFGLVSKQIECDRKNISPNSFLREWFLTSSSNLTSGSGSTSNHPDTYTTSSSNVMKPLPRQPSRSASGGPAPALSVNIPPPLGLDNRFDQEHADSITTPTRSSIQLLRSPSALAPTTKARSPSSTLDQSASTTPTGFPPRNFYTPAAVIQEPSSPSVYWDATSESIRRPSTASTIYNSPGLTTSGHVSTPTHLSSRPSNMSFNALTNKGEESLATVEPVSSMSPAGMSERRRSSVTTAHHHFTPKHLPQVVILERLDCALPRVQQTLLGVLRQKRITIESDLKRSGDPATVGTSSRRMRRTATDVSVGVSHGSEGSWNLCDDFICVSIVCPGKQDEEGATWGNVSNHLMDLFTLSHSIPITSFQSSTFFQAPSISPSHPLAPTTPISPCPFAASALPSYLSDALENYLADLISTIRHHPLLEGRMLSSKASIELTLATRIWVILRGGENVVLPSDVTAVLLSVLGHRLMMKKVGDEKSVFWGSEIDALMVKRKRGRKGVEGVIRSVVAEV